MLTYEECIALWPWYIALATVVIGLALPAMLDELDALRARRRAKERKHGD